MDHGLAYETPEAALGRTVFASLEPQILAELARAATRKGLLPGECLYVEGDPCMGLYIVGAGRFKGLKACSCGREQVVRLVGPGELLNEVGAFATGINPLTIIAIQPSTVWVIERSTVRSLADAHSQIYQVATQYLSSLVVHLFYLVEDLSFCSVEARLARLLLSMRKDEPASNPPWCSQSELATYVGTTTVVVNRALGVLENAGIIRVSRHRIDILNAEALRERAGRPQR